MQEKNERADEWKNNGVIISVRDLLCVIDVTCLLAVHGTFPIFALLSTSAVRSETTTSDRTSNTIFGDPYQILRFDCQRP